MRIARPWALELESTREIMLPLVLREEPPATVLQVGLGAASITRFLHRYFPGAWLTVVEIDARVIEAARQYFRLPDESQRLRILTGEGHEFVAQSKSRFDLIVVDGYDEKARTGSLDTTAFYMAARERLTRGGLMALNLLTRRRGVAASEQRLRQAFGQNVLVVPPPEAGNTIAIAGVDLPIAEPLEELCARAGALKRRTGLNLAPTLARLTRT
jgi:spermidine synthase